MEGRRPVWRYGATLVAVAVAAGWVVFSARTEENPGDDHPMLRSSRADATQPAPARRSEGGLSSEGLLGGAATPALAIADGGEIPAQSRAAIARRGFQQLLRRLDLVRHRYSGAPLESAINMLSEYQMGWIDGVALYADASMLDALSQELEVQLCGEGSDDLHVGAMLAMAQRLPAIASQSGLECVLRRQQEEGLLLWMALDAWRGARLPAAGSYLRWSEVAQDPRTQRRFRAQLERQPRE